MATVTAVKSSSRYCLKIPRTASDRKCESTFMDSSTHDKVGGTAKEGVGKVKEKIGKAIGNRDLEDRGTAEKVSGKVERKVGDVKKVFGK